MTPIRSVALAIAVLTANSACRGERHPGSSDDRAAGRIPEPLEVDDGGVRAPPHPDAYPERDSWFPPPASDMLERDETERAAPTDA